MSEGVVAPSAGNRTPSAPRRLQAPNSAGHTRPVLSGTHGGEIGVVILQDQVATRGHNERIIDAKHHQARSGIHDILPAWMKQWIWIQIRD